MVKRIICILAFLGVLLSGCSHAIIKNTIGGPNGLTYEKTERMEPLKGRQITIKRVNGQLVIINKENTK